jgi:uncharacterized protein (TIGR01244 family)
MTVAPGASTKEGTMRASIGTIFAVLVFAGTAVAAEAPEAPFGDKVDGFVNYNRASPQVGSAGLLGPGGAARAKALGFRMIVDLRGPEEGIAEEREQAAAAGIAYVNIPVTTKAPLAPQVETLARAIEDPANQPVLVHCQSANRVGAAWALYRASKGVPPEVAIEEGRTLGLKPSRESAVRETLNLPPLRQ